MFKFGRIRKRLLQFLLGFWVVIFIPLIHGNIVKGQNNLDSSELIHSDYQEWYDIGAKLGELLNNLADKNWLVAWIVILILSFIILLIVFPKFKDIIEFIKEILSNKKTGWKNFFLVCSVVIFICSVVLTYYLRIPNLTLIAQNTTLENPILYLSSKVDLKFKHDRQDKSNLKYAVCYSKSKEGRFWRDIDRSPKSLNKDNDCLPAFVIDNRFIYPGNLNGIYYWRFKAFEDEKKDDQECEITNLKKCQEFADWSNPIKIAQYKDSLMRIRKTGKVLVGVSTSYNQGLYSLKIEKNGKLERDGIDIKLSEEIKKEVDEEISNKTITINSKSTSNITETPHFKM